MAAIISCWRAGPEAPSSPAIIESIAEIQRDKSPPPAFAGRNLGEPYSFLNFYARGGTSFDRILFAESTQVGGYESDNHIVGQWKRISGTVVPVANSINGVPEPPRWPGHTNV